MKVMGFKTAEDGHVYNDDKKNSGSHHGSVKPETGIKTKSLNKSKHKQLITIESYLDAAHIGQPIDGLPLDSILEYEEGSTDNYKIVGYEGGSTFNSKTIKHISPEIKTFYAFVVNSDDEEIGYNVKLFAINKDIAEKLAVKKFVSGTEIELVESKSNYKPVSTFIV